MYKIVRTEHLRLSEMELRLARTSTTFQRVAGLSSFPLHTTQRRLWVTFHLFASQKAWLLVSGTFSYVMSMQKLRY